MTQKNWWIWLICGTLLGILIMVLFGKGCVMPKTVEHRIYKSDTVYQYITKYVHDTVPKPYEVVLPEKVYIYQDTSTPLNISVDSIGGPKFTYKWGFLSQFPSAPKLISGNFFQDSITLHLLDTSGNIQVKTWPVYYGDYNYYYRNYELLRTNKPDKKPIYSSNPLKISTTGNVYGFYSLVHGGFTVAADYWAMKGKWGVGALGELSSYPQYSNFKIGVKYQFK